MHRIEYTTFRKGIVFFVNVTRGHSILNENVTEYAGAKMLIMFT